LAVNHQAEIIKAFFQNGERWGIRIDYSLEDEPLGTMGPLRLIKDLPEHFLVMNGDILTDLDFTDFHDSHTKEDRVFTVSSSRREHRIDYGVLDIDSSGLLCGFREKPGMAYEVSMGVYMVSSRALQYLPVGRPYGFDNLMFDLLEAKSPATVRSFSGYWLDIGRPDDYSIAIEVFEQKMDQFLIKD
jgi:NDP-sugar pyrophosphorylase family protein